MSKLPSETERKEISQEYPSKRYIAFIDIMRTRAAMNTSFFTSKEIICVFHKIISDSKINDDISLFPIMDGVYVTSIQLKSMLNYLVAVFTKIANHFINKHPKFLIRGAIAFGPLSLGNELYADKTSSYFNSLLVGYPMVQAYTAENLAPPFGIYITETARHFSDAQLSQLWYHWHKNYDNKKELIKESDRYFKSCEEKPDLIGYPQEKIDQHKKLSKQFFQTLTTEKQNHGDQNAKAPKNTNRKHYLGNDT